MPDLTAGTFEELLRLGGVAAVGALAVVLLHRSPRLALAGWLAVLCFVPVWAGVGVLEPQVLITLVVLTALFPLRRALPVRLTAADVLVAGFVLSALLPVVAGEGTVSNTGVLLIRWVGAYLLGRFIAHRVPLRLIYAAVAVSFTVVASLALTEWLTGWNPFHLVPGSGGLREAWATVQERGGVARAEGAFGHSIALGGSVALAVPITLASPFRASVRLGMAVLMGAATAVTFSRIGLGTLVLGLLLVLVFLRTGLSARLRVLLCAGLLIGVGAAAPLVGRVFVAAGDEATGSADYRTYLLTLIEQVEPLGLSESYFRSPTGEASFGTFRSIDSALLLAGLNYGWLPMVFLLAAAMFAVGAVLRRRATAPTIALVAQLPAFATVALITQYASWAWFVVGLAVASQTLTTRDAPAAPATSRGVPSFRRGPVVTPCDDEVRHGSAQSVPSARSVTAVVTAAGGDGFVGVAGYLQMLRRHLRGMVACVVLAIGVASSLSLLVTPTYTSTATLFFSLQNGNTANDLVQGATFTRAQIASYATLATTPAVLAPVIEDLRLSTDVPTLAGRVSATAPNDTVVMNVSATSTSPDEAARITAAVADQLVTVVEEVAPADSDGRATVRVTEVTPAEVPGRPSSPDLTLNVLAGLVGGLAMAVLYAVLRETLDTRVRSAEDLGRLTPLPLLASLDTPPVQGRQRDLVVVTAPRSPAAEAFRSLRTAVQFTAQRGRALSLLVTSSHPGEGKSTVATNLALTLSEAGLRVALVDADLRRPSVADIFDLEGAAGLTTVLIGQAELDDVLQEWGPAGLRVLTTGPLPPNPSELLGSPAMADVMARLGASHDIVIVDGAPLLPVTDSAILARIVSGTLVIGDASRIRRPALSQALTLLERVEARVVGVVLTHVRKRAVDGYGYQSAEPPAARPVPVGRSGAPVAGARPELSSRR